MSSFFYGASIIALIFALRRLHRLHQLLEFSRSNACQPLPRHGRYDILGLSMPLQVVRHFRDRTILPWTHSLFQQHAGSFKARIVGHDYIFTSDPRNIKHLLASQFTDFEASAERKHLFKDVSTRGILTVDGTAWVAAREQLRKQFSHSRALVDFCMLERHVRALRNRVCRWGDGETLDLQDNFDRLAMDVLTEFALGESIDSLAAEQECAKWELGLALRVIKDKISQKGFAGPFHWIVGGKDFQSSCRTVKGYIARVVWQASQQTGKIQFGPNSRHSLAQSLTAEEEDLEVVRDQISNIIIAGADAMTTLMSSTMWLLARHQRVFQQLRSKIEESCGSGAPTYNQLKSLAYLRDVMNEALRLFPPVPFDIRTATKHTTLPTGGGADGKSKIRVSCGQNVLFSSYSSHRWQETYGPDPEAFRPERWLSLKVNDPSYLPFHFGPRSCPGQQYALVACSYMLVRLIQEFPRIEARDTEEWKEDIAMTLRNKNGVLVAFFRA